MKNIARAFVVVLVLAGAAAEARITVETSSNPNRLVAARAAAWPIPTCPPGDPNACGMQGPHPSPNVVSR